MATIQPSTGSRVYVGWALEDQANPGVPVAATAYVPVEPDNLSIDVDMGRKPLETARGTLVTEFDLTEDAAHTSGGLAFPLYSSLGQDLIAACAFNSDGTLGRPQYLTLEIYRAGQSIQHSGMLAKSIKWEVKSKSPTKVTLEFDGIKPPALIEPSIDPTTYTWPVDQPYVWGHAQPAITVGGGSTATPYCDDWEMTVTFQNEMFYGANGTSFPSMIVPGPASLAGKYKSLFTSVADYQSYITTGQTPGALRFAVVRGGNSVTWDLSGAYYGKHSFSQPLKGAIVESIDFHGLPADGNPASMLHYTVV